MLDGATDREGKVGRVGEGMGKRVCWVKRRERRRKGRRSLVWRTVRRRTGGVGGREGNLGNLSYKICLRMETLTLNGGRRKRRRKSRERENKRHSKINHCLEN